jgi:hypothetical protein
MSMHYIIRESQFTLSGSCSRRKIGINPKGVRVDIVLVQGGPVRIGFTQGGSAPCWQAPIHDLHTIHSFDTQGQAHDHVVIDAAGASLARGTVLVWGLAIESADKKT